MSLPLGFSDADRKAYEGGNAVLEFFSEIQRVRVARHEAVRRTVRRRKYMSKHGDLGLRVCIMCNAQTCIMAHINPKRTLYNSVAMDPKALVSLFGPYTTAASQCYSMTFIVSSVRTPSSEQHPVWRLKCRTVQTEAYGS